MDPQRLLSLDKRVVTTIRLCGMAVSLTIGLLCVLIYNGIIIPPEAYYPWACIPAAIAVTVIGLALVFWDPYTYRKIIFYTWFYCLFGALLSILVVGFSSFSFLSWLLLIATISVYLRSRGALVGYGSMLASLSIWLLLHRDLWTLNSIFPLVGSAMVVGAMVAIMLAIWGLTRNTMRSLDVSHEKQYLEHEQLTSLVNSMGDGVIAVDQDAKVILYNAAALNVLDLNTSMQGASIGEFLKPFTPNNAAVDIVNFIQTTRTSTTNRDLHVKYQDGSEANLYISVAPVRLGYGKEGTKGFVILLRDITREKSLEEERDEFISVISHELRTPIAISEGNVSNAQVIAEKSGDMQAVKKALNEAHNQIIFLGDMINDLSTLARAERGKLNIEVEAIKLSDFMKELADNYHQDAEKKGLALQVEAPADLGELRSSRLYVREVLQNFITNAIKYTDKGSVTLKAQQEGDGILFTITDTGIGISKADQERVFDKFFRSEDYRTRQHNGTGLGLYVTMKLARLLQAEITLESELNKGSTFSVFIPQLDQPKPAPSDSRSVETMPAAANAESRA